ncbi:terminase large subunit domain-containing protein [Caldimonas sp. KR1-144]|uniref:terminase large subunit domain-containing protein n=1 Tax=Caldimonas sp. KR1-144 TaxID=3400911 RepID=UPI003C00DC16
MGKAAARKEAKRKYDRESAVADGWVEGQDFHVDHSGKVLSLRENAERACATCNKTCLPSQYYSGLHRSCRRCTQRLARGIEIDSPRAQLMDYNSDVALRARGTEPPSDRKPTAEGVAAFQKELAGRILARRRLLHFIKRFHPGYQDGWVHQDICRRLERFMERVAAGESPRMLLFCPPRLGKSLIASQYFPAWMLGHHPEWEIIAASYNISLPTGFSRRIRETLRDPAYMAMFGETRLSDESQAVEAWRTTTGGGYTAAGVGTGITGKGAHVLIVDDPVKDMEAADSQVIRDGTWEWYLSTAYTRIAPGGGVLGIQTRWHDDDWSGRIILAMQTGEGEQFEVVSYPAINELGDEYLLPDDTIAQLPPGAAVPEGAELLRVINSALHPARYDIAHLQRIKKNFVAAGQARMWSALYQQNPMPDEGAFFKREMFKYVAHAPDHKNGRIFQAWDFSITEKETSDWIVGACMLQDEFDNVYELDTVRFKVDEDGFALVDAIIDFHERWGAWLVGFEDGQIFKSIKAILKRRLAERRVTMNYQTLTPLTDKMVRAGPLRGRMQMGKLFFLQHASFRATVDTELLRFPGGKHDDTVDAYAWCMRLILEHPPLRISTVDRAVRKREKTVAQKLSAYARRMGRVGHMSA